MADCVFARRRYKDRIPTFEQLFRSLTYWYSQNWSTTSKAVRTWTPSFLVAGDIWYLFYFCNGCMEMCRINVTESATMTRTHINTSYRTDIGALHTTLSADGTQIKTVDSVYSATMIMMKFSISPDIVDYMLINGLYSTAAFYYNSTSGAYTGDTETLRTLKSNVTQYSSGVCIYAYRNVPSSGTASNIWGVATTQSPSVPIWAYESGSTAAKSPLYSYTASADNKQYIVPIQPSLSSNTTARVNNYMLKIMRENW